MHKVNLLHETNQSIIREVFGFLTIKLTLEIVKNSKLLQKQLSLSKQSYIIYNSLINKKRIKYVKDSKPPLKDIIQCCLTLTNNESLYLRKDNKFSAHTDSIYAIMQLNNQIIITGSKDQKIKLWEIKQFKCLKTLAGHTSGIFILLKLLKGDFLSASFNGEIIIWNDKSNYNIKQNITPLNKSGLTCLIQLKDERLAMSYWDLSLELYDLYENKTVIIIKDHLQPIIKLAQLSINNDLYTFSRDQTIKIWAIPSDGILLTCNKTIQMQAIDDINKYVTCFHEGKYSRLIVGYSNGSIIITNPSLTRSFGCLKYHSNPITSIISLDKTNNCACCAFNEGIILIIDITNTTTRVIIHTRELFDNKMIQLTDRRILGGIHKGYLIMIGVNSEDFEMKLFRGEIVFKRLKAFISS